MINSTEMNYGIVGWDKIGFSYRPFLYWEKTDIFLDLSWVFSTQSTKEPKLLSFFF
jgi:hypothetical protein